MQSHQLILVIGLPGTGKTTFSKVLAKVSKATHLNSDIVRSEISMRGQYDEESKAIVYSELLRRAEKVLSEGKDLIVDATLYKEALRKPYVEIAERLRIPIKWIELRADEKVIKERVNKTRQYSEADFEVYLKIKAEYEPLKMNHLVLRTDLMDETEMIEQAHSHIQDDSNGT
jgi:predicted kinase